MLGGQLLGGGDLQEVAPNDLSSYWSATPTPSSYTGNAKVAAVYASTTTTGAVYGQTVASYASITGTNSSYRANVKAHPTYDSVTPTPSSYRGNARYGASYASTTYTGAFYASVTVGPTLSANVVTITTDILPAIRAWLVDPGNTSWPVLDAHYAARSNAGHTWGARVSGIVPFGFDPNGKWFLRLQTRKSPTPWQSPPLAMVLHGQESGKSLTTSFAGADYTSWRLATEGMTAPSFFYQPAFVILSWIAALAGVPIGYLGTLIDYSIEDYTIHGGSLMSHVAQICHDFGYTFRIGPGGELYVYPIDYGYDTYRTYLSKSYKAQQNSGALATYLRLQKHSKAGQSIPLVATTKGLQSQVSLPQPWNPASIHVIPQAINGTIQYADFLDKNGASCAYFRFSQDLPYVNPTSNQPAVSVVWDVGGPPPTGPTAGLPVFCRLIVSGRPVGPAGAYDSIFELDYPTQIPAYWPPVGGAVFPPPPTVVNGAGPLIIVGSPTKRYKIASISSALWSTIASMPSIIPRLWMQEQREWYTWSRELSEVDPWFDVGEKVLSDNYGPGARLESTSWSVGQQCSQTLSGYIPPALPSPASIVQIGQIV